MCFCGEFFGVFMKVYGFEFFIIVIVFMVFGIEWFFIVIICDVIFIFFVFVIFFNGVVFGIVNMVNNVGVVKVDGSWE